MVMIAAMHGYGRGSGCGCCCRFGGGRCINIFIYIYVHFVTSVVMLMPMTTGLAAGSNTYDLLIASASACVPEIVEHSSSK